MTKNKLFLAILSLLAFFSLAMTQASVIDQAHIFNQATNNLVTQKNETYQKTKLKEKPIVNLVSVTSNRAFKQLKPRKNQIIIVTIHQQKNNVQILVGSKFKKVLPVTTTNNIIRYAGDDLRSKQNKTFNKGILKVFNACTTLIDQELNLPADKNTLSSEQLQRVNHPQSLNLVWALVVVLIVTFFFSWQKKRNKR
ncbi:TPM domain-containing protein [Lactobacillus sp. PV034]|uniref:TPM domain-containing protein n=1 Tax=Lactobacillus sp. PV034 TaxID=2594495 RepID=UPI00223F82DB|nr:TPM domain-containing protein [Lactobacillus sp. PV034]QNQ80973.1 TPM domain-containing protein [Lactobacillus sp. PV034]